MSFCSIHIDKVGYRDQCVKLLFGICSVDMDYIHLHYTITSN